VAEIVVAPRSEHHVGKSDARILNAFDDDVERIPIPGAKPVWM